MLLASLLVLAGTIVLFTGDKLVLHARVNAFHTPALDGFFGVVTHLADGLVPTAVAVLLLLLSTWRSFLMMALTCVLSAVVTQSLKHLVFADAHRPSMFAPQLGDMSWVAGVELHHHHSFPSGHATAAFAMCFAAAVLIGRFRWAPLLVLLAALMAFSRVYLSQHFLADIVAGSAIGTVTGLVVYQWLYRSAFAGGAWLDRGLLRYRK